MRLAMDEITPETHLRKLKSVSRPIIQRILSSGTLDNVMSAFN